MKKLMKTSLSVIALVCLLVTVLSLSQASDYTPPPGVPGPGSVDFGGQIVTFIGGIGTDREAWSDFWKERIEEAERLFNCKIQGIGSPNPDFIMSRILAGDSTLDVIRMNHRGIGYFKLVSQNMLFPVGDILRSDYYESLSNVDRNVCEKLKFKGKYYSFGTVMGPANSSMFFTAYNKDLLEREGQPDPYELWKNDEWTWEAFERIAKAVTKDTDGDGQIDQWGMTEIAYGAGYYRFLPSDGLEIARIDENGKYVFNYDSPQAIAALNTLVKWRNEDKIMVRDVKFETGSVAFYSYTHLGGCRFAKGKFEWGLVPLPKGPDADRYYFPAFDFNSTFLPANVQNPLGLIALNEFLFRPDDPGFEEQLDWLIDLAVDREEQWEVFLYGAEHWQGEGDPFDGTELWKILTDPTGDIMYGRKGAAAAMDEIRPEAQAFLDDLFGQN
jgi:ABC-type glycerol-3-phosphate transport system substrate-binding protein